jgi:transposase
LLLTGGNVHDIHGARALLAAVPTPRCFLGDKAYDTNDIRAFLDDQNSQAVIPPKISRRDRPSFDPVAYKMRNVIERAFCRSRTGALSPPGTTKKPPTSSQAYASQQPSPTGFNESAP